jgi:hypothetical protein
MNTDLLSTMGVVAGSGAWSDATISTTVIARQSLRLSVQLPNGRLVAPGELFTLHCRAYVTSDLTTSARIRQATLSDGSGNMRCFPTSLALDSAAQFALDAQCGDVTISKVLAGQDISLDNITPNPTTHSTIEVSIGNHTNSDVTAILDVFNVRGEREQSIPITLSANDARHGVSITLTNGEGIRYIRLRMPSGRVIATRSVVVVR